MAKPLRGPRGRGLLGHLRDFQTDELGFYTRSAQYGDLVPVRFGHRRVLLVYHPDAIEEVLVTRNRDFVKSPGVRILRPLLGNGLLLSERELWLRQRRLVQPAFHRQRVAAYGDVMAAYAARHVADWKEGDVTVSGPRAGDTVRRAPPTARDPHGVVAPLKTRAPGQDVDGGAYS